MKYEANPVVVDAVIITSVLPNGADNSGELFLVTDEGADMVATAEMLARMRPVPGDYIVIQSDGYTYLNPKEVFQRKYRPVEIGASVAAADMTPPPPDGPGSITGQ